MKSITLTLCVIFSLLFSAFSHGATNYIAEVSLQKQPAWYSVGESEQQIFRAVSIGQSSEPLSFLSTQETTYPIGILKTNLAPETELAWNIANAKSGFEAVIVLSDSDKSTGDFSASMAFSYTPKSEFRGSIVETSTVAGTLEWKGRLGETKSFPISVDGEKYSLEITAATSMDGHLAASL